MSLSPGARFGPYEILALLGAGGMGEVYRARDARLNRDVALKVLPPGLVGDADRLQRFELEARAAGSLNHPNVMAVFDLGVEDGAPYIVSELLEGQTLRETIAAGALGARKATDLAIQIARGLAAAHAKGIVHRDLKPDNVFVTADGHAKILDFGIAKVALAGDDATRLSSGTMAGQVIGTAGYMAPEQVRGEAVDSRTDIFAFGVVFYEMLAGHSAFAGDSAVERMTAILKSDPPALPSSVPAHLDRIVHRAMEKNPAQRFQSATDIAFALEAMAGTATSAEPGVTRGTARNLVRLLLLAVAVLVLVSLGSAAIAVRELRRPPQGVTTFDAKTFDGLPITNARFMPDGQTIVYSAIPQGLPPALFVINPNAEAPQRLDAPSAHLLSVSSKGELAIITEPRYMAYRVYGGTLSRMTVGSSPRAVAEGVREADWSPDGATMAVVHDLGNGRDRLEFPAGTALYEASGYLNNPRVSPDGKSVAFVEHKLRFDDRGWVKVVTLDGKVTTLTEELLSVVGLAWAQGGKSLVFSGNTSGASLLQPMIVPASGKEPARTAFGVPDRFIVMDAAPDGRWLAIREDLTLGVRAKVPGQETERDLSWIGSTGATSLSADGEWLLMVDVGIRAGQNYGVVLRKTDGSRTLRLGEGLPQGLSPDGKWAAAIISEPASLVLYPTRAGASVKIGTAPIERLDTSQWFPDGQRLLVCGSSASQAPRCYVVSRNDAPPRPLAGEGVLANVAPDGLTLLLSLPDGRYQLSTVDGASPRAVAGLQRGDRLIAWSRDSQSVYVQQGIHVPTKVERVLLATGARTVVGELTPLGVGTIASLYVADWVDDGRWYAYRFTSLPSTLFVVTGAVR